MGMKNDFNFKKAEKAERKSYGHKYELFSVCIGIYKFTLHIKKYEIPKTNHPCHQHMTSMYKEPVYEMSKIVEQGELSSLPDDFFRS